jgi:hypothetical protein
MVRGSGRSAFKRRSLNFQRFEILRAFYRLATADGAVEGVFDIGELGCEFRLAFALFHHLVQLARIIKLVAALVPCII